MGLNKKALLILFPIAILIWQLILLIPIGTLCYNTSPSFFKDLNYVFLLLYIAKTYYCYKLISIVEKHIIFLLVTRQPQMSEIVDIAKILCKKYRLIMRVTHLNQISLVYDGDIDIGNSKDLFAAIENVRFIIKYQSEKDVERDNFLYKKHNVSHMNRWIEPVGYYINDSTILDHDEYWVQEHKGILTIPPNHPSQTPNSISILWSFIKSYISINTFLSCGTISNDSVKYDTLGQTGTTDEKSFAGSSVEKYGSVVERYRYWVAY
jgi:hypothetical protein